MSMSPENMLMMMKGAQGGQQAMGDEWVGIGGGMKIRKKKGIADALSGILGGAEQAAGQIAMADFAEGKGIASEDRRHGRDKERFDWGEQAFDRRLKLQDESYKGRQNFSDQLGDANKEKALLDQLFLESASGGVPLDKANFNDRRSMAGSLRSYFDSINSQNAENQSAVASQYQSLLEQLAQEKAKKGIGGGRYDENAAASLQAEIDALKEFGAAALKPKSQGDNGGAARPKTQAEFDALPSGSLYVDPEDGQTYRKP